MPLVTVWPTPKGLPDGHDLVADAQVIAVRHHDGRQIPGVDLDEGHVGARVGADDLGLVLPFTGQGDADVPGVSPPRGCW